MKRNLLFTVLLIASVMTFGQKLPFQGKLIETGTPVEGTRTFVFEISAVGWSETHTDVQVTGGLYFVVLGSINPLPDSLFYTADEQSMSVTVDGTPLSAVSLFKPLTPPFSGSELEVKNDEGTVVGKMEAANYSYGKNGEVKVFGTNGSENIVLGAISHWQTPGNDFGWMYLSNDEGTGKATLGVTPYRGTHGSGEFHLTGDSLASLNGGFNNFDGKWDYPYFSFNAPTGLRANIDVVKSDTVERGRLYVSSNINEVVSIQPHGLFEYKDGVLINELQAQNWGDLGTSGYFAVHGPNSLNVNISNRHWENPDLPWMKLIGSENQDVIQLSAETDSLESGSINILSKNGNSTYLSANGISTGNNSILFYELTSQNWGGQGQSGLIKVNSPSGQTKVQMTTKSWENAELPWFNMFGTVNNDIVQISAANDSTESGFISVFSRDDKEASFYPTGFRFNRNGQNWREFAILHIDDKDNTGDAGYFGLRGPNSDNINFGGRHWEGNADLPFIHFIGENNYLGIDMGMSKNNEGQQSGFINLMSENGKNLYLSPGNLGVEGVSLSTSEFNTQKFGSLTLHGPNSDNFQLMPSWWENPDLPRMLLLGTSPIAAVDMGAFPENGFEVGQIGLSSTDGSSAHWSPQHLDLHNGFRTVSIASISSNNGTFGSIILDGPNSRNITLMPEWWDKPDMGFFEVSGTNQGRVNIEVNDDGNGQYGLMHLYSDYQKSIRMEPTSIALRDDANGYNPLVLMDVNNDSGNGWAGNINLNGPNSANVIIGAQGNPDLPKIELFGSSGPPVLSIACTPTEEGEAGEIFTRGSNGNGWITYSGNGISGSSALEIQNGANITGILTINGDTIGSGFSSSDRRLKKNIKPIDGDILQKMQELEGVSYDWRKDEFPEKHFSSDKQIGVIAQELEAQFPELVKTNADGYKSVNYNGFTAVLLEAVKELNAKVEKLEAENTELKAELSASVANAQEIEALKAQMQNVLKAVQQASVIPAGAELTSTPGLK